MSCVHIDSRGYGKIYQAVMRNPELPLIAKAVYSYFCAYAGNGVIAFPRREKIVRDLKINKDTYTKYLNMLVAQGYIVKERTATGNLYTVMQTVPAYKDMCKAIPMSSDNDMTDILVLENVKARGFGTVPKLLMLDQRLTAQAKAIYAYFCSFTGAGTTAFPRRTTITRELGITPNTYYSHFNLLLDAGYISVEKRKSSGRYMVNVYHLADNIESPVTAKPALSEKVSRGENGTITDRGEVGKPMSEEFSHGGKVVENSFTEDAMSEGLSSEKVSPDKSAHGDLGHANIIINTKTNNSFGKERSHNHQAPPLDDSGKTSQNFSIQWVKEQIHYPLLLKEVEALAKLKQLLGHFPTENDLLRFKKITREIVEELPRAILKRLQPGKTNDRIFTALEDDVILQLIDDLSGQWNEIRNVKRYVNAAVINLLRQSENSVYNA